MKSRKAKKPICVALLAITIFIIAIINLILISFDLPRTHLRAEIGIYYFCTFAVLYSVVFLMKRAFKGTSYTWQICAHIVLHIFAFLVCYVAPFALYSRLKLALPLLVMSQVFCVGLIVYNGFLWLMFTQNDRKYQKSLITEPIDRNKSIDSQDIRLAPFGCITIALHDDDYREDSDDFDDPEFASTSTNRRRSVAFSEVVFERRTVESDSVLDSDVEESDREQEIEGKEYPSESLKEFQENSEENSKENR